MGAGTPNIDLRLLTGTVDLVNFARNLTAGSEMAHFENCTDRYSSQFDNNYFADVSSEE